MYFPQKWLSIGRLDALLAKTLIEGLTHTSHNMEKTIKIERQKNNVTESVLVSF